MDPCLDRLIHCRLGLRLSHPTRQGHAREDDEGRARNRSRCSPGVRGRAGPRCERRDEHRQQCSDGCCRGAPSTSLFYARAHEAAVQSKGVANARSVRRTVGCPRTPAGPPARRSSHPRFAVTQEVAKDNGLAGYTTYRVSIALHDDAEGGNCYAIFGRDNAAHAPGVPPTRSAMTVPPARQVPTPFGKFVGGVDPTFFSFSPESEFDSWLTVAVSDGNNDNAISSIGIVWDDWSETAGISITDGSVFWMDPDKAPNGKQLIGQFTIPASATAADRKFVFNAQGRSNLAAKDHNWQAYQIVARLGGPADEPEPEPATAVDCVGSWGPWGMCNVCGPTGLKKRTWKDTVKAQNGGADCPYKDKATSQVACKDNERPCSVVPHTAIACRTSPNVVTTVAGIGDASAIFDFTLTSAQTVTLVNQLPKVCPELSLYTEIDTTGTPLQHVNNGVCQPIKAVLQAGRYTLVAQTHMSRPSNVRMTVLCKAAPDGNNAAPDKTPTDKIPAETPKEEDTAIEVLVAGGVVAVVGGLCVLCVMKRASGATFARKRQDDLDAHLDSGLDDDFGYGSAQAGAQGQGQAGGFSTQSIQSISTGRHTFAE